MQGSSRPQTLVGCCERPARGYGGLCPQRPPLLQGCVGRSPWGCGHVLRRLPNGMQGFQISNVPSRHDPCAALLDTYAGTRSCEPAPFPTRVGWQTGIWARIQAGAELIRDRRLMHTVCCFCSSFQTRWLTWSSHSPVRVGGRIPVGVQAQPQTALLRSGFLYLLNLGHRSPPSPPAPRPSDSRCHFLGFQLCSLAEQGGRAGMGSASWVADLISVGCRFLFYASNGEGSLRPGSPVLGLFQLLLRGVLMKPGLPSLTRKPAIHHVSLVRLPTFGSFWNIRCFRPFRHICRALQACACSPVSAKWLT